MYLSRVDIRADRFPASQLYPFCVPVLRDSSHVDLRGNVTFFVGENGSGKSTLLEAIANRASIQPWHKPKRHVVHYNPFETRFCDYIDLTWADKPVPGSLFRAETFRDFADFLDDVALCDPGRLEFHGGKLLTMLSHGQGTLSYLQGRCRARGLYLLDEPEAALSPASQVQFVQVLHELGQQGHAQFIVATHSPILLACPGAQILGFDSASISEIDYMDTPHYQIYQQFLAQPDQFFASPDGGKEVAVSANGQPQDTLSIPTLGTFRA